MNYMKRQEARLDAIELKLGQCSIDEVRDKWTMEQIDNASTNILEKAKEDRLELEAKVTKIYVDHLLLENEIGPGEECKFPNLIQYTKHQFSKQHENYLQTNRDIAAHRLDFEQLDEKCTNQFEKEIPTEMHLKQEGINECKRMIWELENNTLK